MTHRERRSYDHRIKAQVAATGDPNWFSELQIPRSTAMSWIRRGVGEVVVEPEFAVGAIALLEVCNGRRRSCAGKSGFANNETVDREGMTETACLEPAALTELHGTFHET